MCYSWRMADDGPLFSLRRGYECAWRIPLDQQAAIYWSLLQEDLTVALEVIR